MKQIYFLLFLLNVATFTGTNAQTDSAQRETSVIFFGSEQPDKAKRKFNAHALKVGLFDIASGMYGIHYEKELGAIFSIQAGAGLTGRNFMQNLLEMDEASFDESPYFTTDDNADFLYDFDTRKSTIGNFFAIHPKLYYDEEGIDGQYFGFVFQNRNYYFEAMGLDPYSSTIEYSASEPTLEEDENQTIYAISWGSQTLNKKTALDFHTALGVRNISGTRRDTGYYYDPLGGGGIPTYVMSDYKKNQLYVEFYLRLGIWWE